MARGRMISKCLSTSEKYAALLSEAGALGEFCQALYPLVVAHADDWGRLQADSFTIKHLVLPFSPRSLDEFTAALQALHNVGLVQIYSTAGRSYMQVIDFDEHQTGLHKRIASRLPEPPGNSGKFPLKRTEEKGTEQKRREEEPSAALRATPSVLVFPTIGTDGSTWGLTATQIAEWDALYGAVDVEAEARKALAWLTANPGRRKTGRGMPKFLVNWLNRAVDRGQVARSTTTGARRTEPSGTGRGNCPHEPRCARTQDCIDRVIREGRATRGVTA